MKNTFFSAVLTLLVVASLSGCYFYFKKQFSLYSIKVDTFSDLTLEKEQTFRLPRAKALKVFRPPRVVPGFMVLAAETLRLSEDLTDKQMDEMVSDIPPSLREQAKKVARIEALVKNYVKDGYDLLEMKAFGLVSKTLTARLLACYNALVDYKRSSHEINQLKETIKHILVENSEVTYFEIVITFEDTLSAFPDVAINLLDVVDSLKITKDEKISYYSLFLNRRLSERISYNDLDRERSIHLALEKLKKQGLEEAQIDALVENFISKNSDDPEKRQQALSITNGNFIESQSFDLEE